MTNNGDLPDEERQGILADVAELYYTQGLNQNQIARTMGVDRSTVSRMLADARRLKIVEVSIHHPLISNPELESRLEGTFDLLKAIVITDRGEGHAQLLTRLGSATAKYLKSALVADMTVGLSWGTAVSAVVEAIEPNPHLSMKVIQLVGALGSQNKVYDGHGLLQRLAQKFNSQTYFLNAPFLVKEPQTALALENTPSIQTVIDLAKRCDLAIVGIGSLEADSSSFYQAGYVSAEDFLALQQQALVGDICGRHFTITGDIPDNDFHNRIIAIKPQDLRCIPLRVAVAGGDHKVLPILGALRSGLANVLVTSENTARRVLEKL